MFDHVGGRHLWRPRRAAKRTGTVVCYGFAGAVGGRDERRIVRQTHLAHAASKLMPGPKARLYAILARPFSHTAHVVKDLGTLAELLDRGAIGPRIGASLPLDRVDEAHAMLEGGRVTDKIIMDCRQLRSDPHGQNRICGSWPNRPAARRSLGAPAYVLLSCGGFPEEGSGAASRASARALLRPARARPPSDARARCRRTPRSPEARARSEDRGRIPDAGSLRPVSPLGR